MYNELIKNFVAYNGEVRLFHHRNETTDISTIISIFEKDEYHLKEIGINDGDVIIDIGSHIGGLPILLSTIAKNLGVYCYEPIPENYRLLFKNLEDNDLQGFGYCWQKAVVGAKRERIKIFYGNDSFEGLAHKFIGTHVEHPPENFNRKYINSETITLEQIFKENKIAKCKLLKIDCEGQEYDIFKNTPREIFDKIEFIVGEHHGVGTHVGNRRDYLHHLAGKDIFDDISSKPTNSAQGEFLFKHK